MVQHYSPFWLYFPAFAVVIVGLIIYFWYATRESFGFVRLCASAHDICQSPAEEQGKLNPQRPDYVGSRQADEEVVV